METPAPESDVIAMIEGARAGDRSSIDRLFTLVYGELRVIARRLSAHRSDTLATTALVHEAYLRLVGSRRLELADRAHFTYIAARAMRQVLSALARRKATLKRSPGLLVTFNDAAHPTPHASEHVVALEEALASLERFDPRKASVVECRFFGGMDVEETAAALGVSAATVKRDWRFARAWLAQHLQ